MHHKDLLLFLHERGLLEWEKADRVLSGGEFADLAPLDALVSAGLLSPGTVARTLAEVYCLPYLDLKTAEVSPKVMALLPREHALNHCVIPVAIENERLILAMADPVDVVAEDVVKLVTGLPIDRVVAARSQILELLGEEPLNSDSEEAFEAELSGVLEKLVVEGLNFEPQAEDDLEAIESEANEAPVIHLVNMILKDCLRLRASDIHIEPQEEKVQVRFRIDGLLRPICELPKKVQRAVASRIKLVSGLDISEKRRPQDGRTQLRIKSQSINFRTSTLPSYYGEKVVMRLLRADPALMNLSNLGFDSKDLARLTGMLDSSQGMVLVTGPTGSGKTSTLYASLGRLNQPHKNVVTVEDPVEYQLENLTQVSINNKAGLTFQAALKAILRQDPDVVMLGEIRDFESAEMAFHAAQTGHLVLSTLHTNSAPATLTRLVQMGLPRFLLTSSLLGIVAQRLVRKLCQECKIEVQPPEILLQAARAGTKRDLPTCYFTAPGCGHCDGTGYSGRIGLYEVFPLTDSMRALILEGASEAQLEAHAGELGVYNLLEDGLRKVERGLTTLEELMRVARSGRSQMEGGQSVESDYQESLSNEIVKVQAQGIADDLLLELLKLVEERSGLPQGHNLRVADLSRALGQALDIPEDDLEVLYQAALYKDLGMLRVPEAILGKTGRLSNEELATVANHVEWSLTYGRMIPLPPSALKIIHAHHEQPAGGGYPQGRSEADIPQQALIIAVADTYNAFLADRPYRSGMTAREALKKLEGMAQQGWLCPGVVQALVDLPNSGLTF